MLFGVAVPHQGTQEHLDQERIGEDLFEDLARRAIEVLLLQIVVVGKSRQEFGERVLLMGELFSNLVLKEFDVVVKAQFDTGKGDARTSLRGQLKVVPSKPQLLEQPCQRPFLCAPLGEVGHRMEPDIVVSTVDPIERVQAADRPVLFKNAHAMVVHGKPDASGQPAHPGTDDDRVKIGLGARRFRMG